MFGIFKKTSWKVDGKALAFFRQVFSKLPSDYEFLKNGIDNGLYTRFSLNHTMKGHFYTIGFDPTQSDKSITKGENYVLENILIEQDGRSYPLNMTIYDGLWIGFEFEKNILDFKNFQIDLSSFRKNRSKFCADTRVISLVSELTCDQLDLSNLGEFDIDGKRYYQIKDLENGNYIAIDVKGQVFGLIHEPYKIELINKSVKQFVSDVNKGQFDFERYLIEGKGNA